MPTAKAINSYPIELLAIAEKVLSENIEVPVDCADMRELNSLRMQVYGLRKAMGETDGYSLQLDAPRLSTKVMKDDDGKLKLLICTVDGLVTPGLRQAAEGL